MIKILPIVVIYNIDWKLCNIYKSLFSQYGKEILLYDNSIKDFNKIYKSKSIHYIHDKSNSGVSTAYNCGAKWAKKHGFSHIVLFDDDTILPPQYIDLLYEAIRNNPNSNIFVPTLKYNNGERIFSPINVSGLKRNKQLKPNRYSLKRYLPVNSGSCINIKCFFSVGGFNEKIPLDFSDFDFFTRLSKNTDSFRLIDCQGEQYFSNNETEPNKLIERYKLYLQGAKEFCHPYKIQLQVFKHSLSLFVRTHKIVFIKLYFKYFWHDFCLHCFL